MSFIGIADTMAGTLGVPAFPLFKKAYLSTVFDQKLAFFIIKCIIDDGASTSPNPNSRKVF